MKGFGVGVPSAVTYRITSFSVACSGRSIFWPKFLIVWAVPLSAAKTGSSWVLQLEVDRKSYPFLVHVDDAGMPSLLFPDGDVTSLDAGEQRQLPKQLGPGVIVELPESR